MKATSIAIVSATLLAFASSVSAFPFGSWFHRQPETAKANTKFFEIHPWLADSTDDPSTFSRGPCPALNTLANHGYINRDGKNITTTQLINALSQVYSIDASFAKTLANGALKQLGRPVDNADDEYVLNELSDLNNRGAIEHDASLTRSDLYIAKASGAKTNLAINATLIDKVIDNANAKDATYSAKEFGKLRKLRYEESKLENPEFEWSITNKLAAYGEAALLLLVFGNGERVSLDRLLSVLRDERLPEGYVPPTESIGLLKLAPVLAKIVANSF